MSDSGRSEPDWSDKRPGESYEQNSAQGEAPRDNPGHLWQECFFWVYVVLALAGFSALSILAYQTPYLPFDPAITLALQSYNPAWFFTLMVVVSWPGYLPQAALLEAVLVALIYTQGYRWEALIALLAGVSALLLDAVIKILVHQPRPLPDLVHVDRILKTYSFPSGHVMYFMGFYAFLWYLSYKVLKPSWLRTFLLLLLGSMVLLVGVSRIYLGEHWFSDVLGAYVLGSVVLVFAIRVYHWGKPRYSREKGGREKG